MPPGRPLPVQPIIKPREVIARLGVHLRSARNARQGAVERSHPRNALGAFGYATLTVLARDGCLMSQTPLAQFGLTARQAEVLYREVKSKINRVPLLPPSHGA